MLNLGYFLCKSQPQLEVLNYWNKVINGKKDNICFLIYNMVKHLNCIGKYTSPWLGYVTRYPRELWTEQCVDISCSKWLSGVQ